jgi:ribosome assembly protein RRB1
MAKKQKDASKPRKRKTDADGYLLEREEVEEAEVWLPGMGLQEGEQLEADPQAYRMLHTLTTEWPCLSFDFALHHRHHVGDNVLEDGRTRHPPECTLVTGTTTSDGSAAKLLMVRCHDLKRTGGFQSDEDESDESSESDESDDNDDEPAIDAIDAAREEDQEELMDGEQSARRRECMVQPKHDILFQVDHDGNVNRVRCLSLQEDSPNQPLVATFSDRHRVHVFRGPDLLYTTPKHTHRAEGFALAWRHLPSQSPLLLSGDATGLVNLFAVSPASVQLLSSHPPSSGHDSGGAASYSVEDLNWSPGPGDCQFAGACTDGCLRLWDIRSPSSNAAMQTIPVARCDLNVLSWNVQDVNLMCTGAEDGAVTVLDLRSPSQPLFRNDQWHLAAITTVEWHPTESAVLAVGGDDNQVSLWDLEAEPVDPKADLRNSNRKHLKRVPPQLLFVHAGQTEVRELHWHPEVPGLLASTAASGFHLFRTISI